MKKPSTKRSKVSSGLLHTECAQPDRVRERRCAVRQREGRKGGGRKEGRDGEEGWRRGMEEEGGGGGKEKEGRCAGAHVRASAQEEDGEEEEKSRMGLMRGRGDRKQLGTCNSRRSPSRNQ
eukprot:734828-Rhodomonas_salina.1